MKVFVLHNDYHKKIFQLMSIQIYMPCLLNTCKFMINNSSKVTKISRNLENMKEKKSSTGNLILIQACSTFLYHLIVPRFLSCKVSNGKGLSDSKANCITWLISVRTNSAFKLQRNVNDTKTNSEWSYWVHIKDILQNEMKSSLCSNSRVKTISPQKDPNTLDAQQKLQLYSKY